MLVVTLLAALLTKWLDELHVDLQLVSGALSLLALPPGFAALVVLGAGESAHADPVQYPSGARGADLDLVVQRQVHRHLAWPEVVALPQPQDLLDDLGLGRLRRVVRGAGSVLGSFEAFLFIASEPLLVTVPADAVVAAGGTGAAADFFHIFEHGELVLGAQARVLVQSQRSPLDQRPGLSTTSVSF